MVLSKTLRYLDLGADRAPDKVDYVRDHDFSIAIFVKPTEAFLKVGLVELSSRINKLANAYAVCSQHFTVDVAAALSVNFSVHGHALSNDGLL